MRQSLNIWRNADRTYNGANAEAADDRVPVNSVLLEGIHTEEENFWIPVSIRSKNDVGKSL